MIYSTLLLKEKDWDLSVDDFGNIAMDSTSYAVAQDVASAVKTVLGELFYDTTIGIPYQEQILGVNYVPQLVKSYVEQAALTVPGVVSALATLSLNSNRILTGKVSVIDENGAALEVSF